MAATQMPTDKLKVSSYFDPELKRRADRLASNRGLSFSAFIISLVERECDQAEQSREILAYEGDLISVGDSGSANLLDMAITHWLKEGGDIPSTAASDVEERDGADWVVLRNVNGVLAVYLVVDDEYLQPIEDPADYPQSLIDGMEEG